MRRVVTFRWMYVLEITIGAGNQQMRSKQQRVSYLGFDSDIENRGMFINSDSQYIHPDTLSKGNKNRASHRRPYTIQQHDIPGIQNTQKKPRNDSEMRKKTHTTKGAHKSEHSKEHL